MDDRNESKGDARPHGGRQRQWTVTLEARPRGVHLVTDELLAPVDLSGVRAAVLHVFCQHTSASIALGENASPAVRRDLERWLRHAVPDGGGAVDFEHTLEGPDDMPAHVKAALLGSSLLLPVRRGRLALGTWQGIYLCEHRQDGGARSFVLTLL